MRLRTKAELEDERKQQDRTRQTVLDRTRLALAYTRQSTEKQVTKHTESAREQQELKDYAQSSHYQWDADKIMVINENLFDKWGNALVKPRSASGQRDSSIRAGLRQAERLIETDKVGAVFIDDVSRLFRDPDMIDGAQFAKLCKDHHVVIVEYATRREYDFNATSRNDLEDFLEECRIASSELKTMQKRMLQRKERKGMRGEHVGTPIPTGFMLDDNKRDYLPNPVWCDVVKRLTRRYRELDGDLTALYNQDVRGKPIFPDLPEDIRARVGSIRLRKVDGGYTIAKQPNLANILIHPANIGHRVYKQRIVKWDAHPAIVDVDDYHFALQRLGAVDLEGNSIETEPRAKRFTQAGTIREGLLSGVRSNGQPVITSPQGNVYVFQTGVRPAFYVIKDTRSLDSNPFVGSILVTSLDILVQAYVKEKLNLLLSRASKTDAFYDTHFIPLYGESEKTRQITQKLKDNARVERTQAQAMLDHIATLKVQVTSDLKKIDTTIADIEQEIMYKKREYEAAKHTMHDTDIAEHYASLARLRNRLQALQKKRKEITKGDAEIVNTMTKLERAREEWDGWEIGQKQAAIRLMTQSITLDKIADGWMKLTIVWHPILADRGFYDYAVLFQRHGTGAHWTGEEEAILQDMYPYQDKVMIMCALPKRTWDSIKTHAARKGIQRGYRERNDGLLGDDLSLEDVALMEAYGIHEEEIRQGVRVWLGVEQMADINSDGLPDTG